jgi:hypothetical protein
MPGGFVNCHIVCIDVSNLKPHPVNVSDKERIRRALFDLHSRTICMVGIPLVQVVMEIFLIAQ